jgi:hypothetical protein
MNIPSSTRGAALAETALVLTGILALIFGVIQIGVIGYLQITADGAAFIAAHEFALGNATTAQSAMTLAQGAFPEISGASGFLDQNAANTTTVPVNFNFTNPNSRAGGLSLIRGQLAQITIVKSAPRGLLGVGVTGLSNVSVHGVAVEPNNLVVNNGWDVSSTDYNSAAALQASADLNPFTSDENVPANYVSDHYMATCTQASYGAQCNANNVSILALGTAEFLDDHNWNRTQLGVSPTGTFEEMLCHQQIFAAAAALFPATMPDTTTNTYSKTNTASAIGKIYSWDFQTGLGGGYTVNSRSFGEFPLTPLNNCP